jgi:hypothetical protein
MRDTLAFLRQVVVSKLEPIWNKAKDRFLDRCSHGFGYYGRNILGISYQRTEVACVVGLVGFMLFWW